MDAIKKSLPRKLGTEPIRAQVSGRLPDGSIVEQLYQPEQQQTRFCVGKEGHWRFENTLITQGERWIPYSAKNNLIQNRVILLKDSSRLVHGSAPVPPGSLTQNVRT